MRTGQARGVSRGGSGNKLELKDDDARALREAADAQRLLNEVLHGAKPKHQHESTSKPLHKLPKAVALGSGEGVALASGEGVALGSVAGGAALGSGDGSEHRRDFLECSSLLAQERVARRAAEEHEERWRDEALSLRAERADLERRLHWSLERLESNAEHEQRCFAMYEAGRKQLSKALKQRDKALQTAREAQAAQAEPATCVICLESEREAVLIHGQTAHACACMACAKRLQRCPICRLPVDMVVRSFSA
jgi:hypothetical protein